MDNTKKLCTYEQSYIVRPEHMNGNNRLFGGQLLYWVDEFAGIVARRYCNMNVTTACIDNLNFIAGAHINDTVVLYGKVTFVGTSSIEVQVKTYIENLNGDMKLINIAYLVEVAVDDNGNTCKVEKFIPETQSEIDDWKQGEKRYLDRKLRQSK